MYKGVTVMQIANLLGIAFAWSLIFLFIMLNLVITLGKLMSGKFTKYLTKTLDVKLPEETSQAKRRSKIYTIQWILIGSIISLITLYDSITGSFIISVDTLISAIVAFMTYRSGSNLSYRIIAWKHDLKVLEANTEDSLVLKIVSKAAKFGISISVLFAVVWSLFYKLIRLNINLVFSMDPSLFTLLVWGIGILIGLPFSLYVIRSFQSIALKSEIGLVSFFLIKEKYTSVQKKSEETARKIMRKAGDMFGV